MGDPLTPEILAVMIRQYSCQHLSEEETISALNYLRRVFYEISLFVQEPVDCVLWVKADEVTVNDYNPNVMTSGEKKLLKHSLEQDGFTQPMVVPEEKEHYPVVDGFHHQLLGREAGTGKRLRGWLPVIYINSERKGRAVRMAATIRHSRARGKHQTTSMSDVVRGLSRLGWSDERIGTELGMDQDEVLRLRQISGLTELFQDESFSPVWTVRQCDQTKFWSYPLSMQKRILEGVEDLITLKFEAAGCWCRASARWLIVMGATDITDAQREWLLLRRKYCLA